jgi:hypothetical protein
VRGRGVGLLLVMGMRMRWGRREGSDWDQFSPCVHLVANSSPRWSTNLMKGRHLQLWLKGYTDHASNALARSRPTYAISTTNFLGVILFASAAFGENDICTLSNIVSTAPCNASSPCPCTSGRGESFNLPSARAGVSQCCHR